MEIELTLKNYRCFSDNFPARFAMGEGFTAFLGINNAGKSAILRFFYELRPIFANIHGNPSMVLPGAGLRSINFPQEVKDPFEVFCNLNDRDLEIGIEILGDPTSRVKVTIIIDRQMRSWTTRLYVKDGTGKFNELPPNLSLSINSQTMSLAESGHDFADFSALHAAIGTLANTLYIGPFRNAINLSPESMTRNTHFDILTGQDFIRQWRNWKTGNYKQHNEAALQVTEDLRRIFGYRSLEINAGEDATNLQAFVNEKSYKLTELGSGLAQFFMVLATAAMSKPSFVLIDEPELHLHASLQLDFLTTLASYTSTGVLFATHGIGLARASADRIYNLKREEAGHSLIFEYESTPRLSEFLGGLGFSSYKEVGFDKVLLVEGPTETKTIQQFLRKLHKDHQVVILPMGGFQMITEEVQSQLTEIKRISNHVYALIDSERASVEAPLESRRAAFVQECAETKIPCHVLVRRAIENYLSDSAIKQIKGDKYRALSSFEKLSDLPHGWNKRENWRIARAMGLEELSDTDLGDFLSHL